MRGPTLANPPVPADSLAATHAACFAAPRAWSAADFQGTLASPGIVFLGSAGSFLLGRVLADEAEILTLATLPALQRRGRARALVAGFVARAAVLGAATAFLEVAADNGPACALYRAAGFGVTGRRRGYYRNADGSRTDALVMARPIRPHPDSDVAADRPVPRQVKDSG